MWLIFVIEKGAKMSKQVGTALDVISKSLKIQSIPPNMVTSQPLQYILKKLKFGNMNGLGHIIQIIKIAEF